MPEDRLLFKQAMQKIGVDVPKSGVATSLGEALDVMKEVGLPCVLRPSFTLGGSGGGIAYNRDEFIHLVETGLALSPVTQILIEDGQPVEFGEPLVIIE